MSCDGGARASEAQRLGARWLWVGRAGLALGRFARTASADARLSWAQLKELLLTRSLPSTTLHVPSSALPDCHVGPQDVSPVQDAICLHQLRLAVY